jgi:2-hydroxychromene-2-carboxylate isomerase
MPRLADMGSGENPMVNCFLSAVLLTTYTALAHGAEPVATNPAVSNSPQAPRAELYIPEPAPTGEKWQAGLHYNVLLPPKDPLIQTDDVELLELSMYATTPLSASFRASFERWLGDHASKIRYSRQVPIVRVAPLSIRQARMFFTLEALGRADLHERMGVLLRDVRVLEMYADEEEGGEEKVFLMNAEFARHNGIGRSAFERAYFAPTMRARLDAQAALAARCQTNGLPTFVIDDRFSVSVQRLAYPNEAGDQDMRRLLELIDYLTNAALDHKRRVSRSSLPHG